jgi:predicted ATP-grasp superfamily ATP-dependent carboligase
MRVADASTPTVVLIASPEPLLHGAMGVVRSLGRLGIPVYVASDGRPMPTDRSRYLAGSFTVVHDQAEPARWVEELAGVGRSLGRRAVLIPIDDLGALAVNDHADRLAEWFLFPRPDPGLARTLASKRELHLLCRRLGVPSPETVFPKDRRDVLGFLEWARPPVVVKAIDPLLLYQRPGARSVMVAHSRRELLEIYDRMEVPERPNLMLQEYIPGGPESIWMFNGYLDGHGRCLVGFTGTKQRQCLPHTGPTSLGICRHNPVVAQATTEFLAAVGYQGVVDLGWRHDARDGRKWLVEPNDLRASLASWREGALTPGQWLGSLRGWRRPPGWPATTWPRSWPCAARPRPWRRPGWSGRGGRWWPCPRRPVATGSRPRPASGSLPPTSRPAPATGRTSTTARTCSASSTSTAGRWRWTGWPGWSCPMGRGCWRSAPAPG